MDKERIGLTIFVIIVVLFGLWLVPFVFMKCWNNVMPYLFGLKTIDFWQSFCLNMMAWILIYKVPTIKNN